jgi:hypothetical protein
LAHLAILLHRVGGGGGRSWKRRPPVASGRRRNSGVRWRQADRWIRIEEDGAKVSRGRRMRSMRRRREEEATSSRGGGSGLARASHEDEVEASHEEDWEQ